MEGSSSIEEFHATDKTVDIGTGLDDDVKVEAEAFPKRLYFGPAWAGGSYSFFPALYEGRSLAEKNLETEKLNAEVVFGQRIFEEETTTIENPLGSALENLGYGFGVITFQGTEDAEADTELSIMAYGERKMAYTIAGDILALGVTDETSYDNFGETDIMELDYGMELDGYRLTLTFNGESAVYVPEQIENENRVDINCAGPVEAGVILDEIHGITISSDENSLMRSDVHEGYIDTEYNFQDDGTVTINVSDGESYKYNYIYSGDSLTLTSDKDTAVYSLYTYSIASSGGRAAHTFYADGNEIRLSGQDSLKWLIEKGFETDIDLNQQIASCQLTEEFVLTYGNGEIIVKAVNPYDETISLGDCLVCSVYCEDTTGTIVQAAGNEVGSATYEEIEFIYEAPYEKTEDLLRYKSTTSGIVNDFERFELLENDLAMDIYGDKEVIYEFENGILESFRLDMPALLYNGLQDNVDTSVLEAMEPKEFTGVIEVRDTILDRLRTAFSDAGISVEINENTGEIVMNNDVLFGFDQSVLSEEGKQYIDSFMGVYASVITDEEFAEYVEGVVFEGHTDSSGSYEYNLTLSEARAESVMMYCLGSSENGMTDAEKTALQKISSTVGYSFSDPVYDENGNEDAQASRRVAIKFYVSVE